MGQFIYSCTDCHNPCTDRHEAIIEKSGTKCVPKNDPEEFVIKNVGPGSFAMYKEEEGQGDHVGDDDLKLNESLEIIQMKNFKSGQLKPERSATLFTKSLKEPNITFDPETLSNKMNSERHITQLPNNNTEEENPYMVNACR